MHILFYSECMDVLSSWDSGAGTACLIYSTRSEYLSMGYTIDPGVRGRTSFGLRSGKVVVRLRIFSVDRSRSRNIEGMYKQGDVKDLKGKGLTDSFLSIQLDTMSD